MKKNITKGSIILVILPFFWVACKQDEKKADPPAFSNFSKTPSLVSVMPGFEILEITPLISSEDTLQDSPAFVFGAQPDGQGLIKNPSGNGYYLITNHEITRAVSRVYLDKNLKPVKGEYIVDAEGGQWRLCSATMATPEEHGFGPLFLTAGEGNVEGMVHGIKPDGPITDRKNKDRILPALGKASMENAVPLTKHAYPGKTVIMISEDQGPSNGHQSAGQLNMYMSNTVGDLNNGRFYQLARTNRDFVETNMIMGNQYDVEFIEIPDVTSKTGKQINDEAVVGKSIRFARIEDVDYRKGSAINNREIYFVATGVSNNRIDPVTGYTMWGRLYKLVLDPANPLKGTLQVVMDGSINPGKDLVNPDNVCATENYVYVQEDSDNNYVANTHDAYIWQYQISSGIYKSAITMHHRRTDIDFNSKFNPNNITRLGTWEYGAMHDISDIVGLPNTFLLNIQPHTWVDDKFLNPDGSGLVTNKEGGQTLIIRGLAK